MLQEDGKLRCPAGASLNFGRSASRECLYESWLSTWPIRRIVSPVLCESSVWQKAAKGDRARRVSAVRRLLPPPAPVQVSRKPVLLGPIRWVDVAGRALRRTWMSRLSQAIRRDPSACRHAAEPFPSPSPTTCGAVASPLELARSARTQRLVGTTAVPCHCRWRSRFSSYEVTKEELATKEAFSRQCISLRVDQQGEDRVSPSRKTCLSSPEVF